jgi:glucose-1-phosphate thymidylyltransferase
VTQSSRAVVLARGLGTRLREADAAVNLTPEQQRSADAGLKPMVPVNGRPFVEYVLGAIADAGVRRVALVVAPDHLVIRRHFEANRPSRLTIDFVVQDQPLGTANAVLAAEKWAAGDPFLAMNADNLYPVAALAALASSDEPGLLAFDADDLVRTSNIPAERVRAFALVEADDDGYLVRIVEKPRDLSNPSPLLSMNCWRFSMNCWRFDARIFGACRDVPRSPRGEFELPDAVTLAMGRGVRFRVLRAGGPVLDLSRRADMIDLARRLDRTSPRP